MKYPQNQQWMELFLDNCRQSNKSEETLKNYFVDIRKFIAWFEDTYDRPIHKADGQTISLYKEYLVRGGHPNRTLIKHGLVDSLIHKLKNLKKKEAKRLEYSAIYQAPLAVSSRRRHLSTLKNFFEFLKQHYEDHSKIFEKNPVRSKLHGIRLKDQDVDSTVVLRADDWEKIDDITFRTDERLMVNLLYWAGMRLDELYRLRTSHFDYETKTIKFSRKGGGVHTLRPQKASEIFQLLEVHLRTPEGTGEALFHNKKGRPLSKKTLYNRLMKIFQKAQCRPGLTPHSFRKGCATRLYVETQDLLFVRDYLNHSDAKVTQTYIDKAVLAERDIQLA